MVDGETLSESDYTATKGSVNISLKDSFLNTLAAGTHTITVVFEDASLDASFTVTKSDETTEAATTEATTTEATTEATITEVTTTEATTQDDMTSDHAQTTADNQEDQNEAKSPRTGDESSYNLWIAGMLISLLAMIMLFVIYNKRRNNRLTVTDTRRILHDDNEE